MNCFTALYRHRSCFTAALAFIACTVFTLPLEADNIQTRSSQAGKADYVPPAVAAWPATQDEPPVTITPENAESIRRRAEAGDSKARLAMGLLHVYSNNQYQLGQPWFELAARQGEADAFFYLTLPQVSAGQTPDKASLKAWKKAAGMGSRIALLALSRHYLDLGKSPSPQQFDHLNTAVRWMRKGVKAGLPETATWLGFLYYGSVNGEIHSTPDIVLAYAWHAIAQRGYDDQPVPEVDNDVEIPGDHWPRVNLSRLRELETLILPSEKARALAILSRWPAALPPARKTAPLPAEYPRPPKTCPYPDAELATIDRQNPPDQQSRWEMLYKRLPADTATYGHMPECMAYFARFYRDINDSEKSAAWYEKAIAAGDAQALAERLAQAEQGSDIPAIIRLTTLTVLRADSIQTRESARHSLGALRRMAPDSTLRLITEAEKWHQAHPVPLP